MPTTVTTDPAIGAIADICARAEKSGEALGPTPTNAVIECRCARFLSWVRSQLNLAMHLPDAACMARRITESANAAHSEGLPAEQPHNDHQHHQHDEHQCDP